MAPSVKWQIKECTTNFFSLILLKEKQLSTVTVWIQTVCDRSRRVCLHHVGGAHTHCFMHIHHLWMSILHMSFINHYGLLKNIHVLFKTKPTHQNTCWQCRFLQTTDMLKRYSWYFALCTPISFMLLQFCALKLKKKKNLVGVLKKSSLGKSSLVPTMAGIAPVCLLSRQKYNLFLQGKYPDISLKTSNVFTLISISNNGFLLRYHATTIPFKGQLTYT